MYNGFASTKDTKFARLSIKLCIAVVTWTDKVCCSQCRLPNRQCGAAPALGCPVCCCTFLHAVQSCTCTSHLSNLHAVRLSTKVDPSTAQHRQSCRRYLTSSGHLTGQMCRLCSLLLGGTTCRGCLAKHPPSSGITPAAFAMFASFSLGHGQNKEVSVYSEHSLFAGQPISILTGALSLVPSGQAAAN